MLATIVMTILVFILFLFFVIMFIAYFDYILSIASLSLYLCISSHNACSKVHGVSGRHCVSVVLIRYLPMDTPYILSHVVDHGCDTPVESIVVHSPNIGIQVGSSYEGRQALFLIFLSNMSFVSRILVMVYFSINSISYQYMFMPDLPCGKNINNDTGILSGEVLQWYNYLCACRSFSFIYLYILPSHIN